MQAVGDPTAPMLIALAADGIGATQEGPAHAAVNEVVPGRGIQRDERGTGLSHGSAQWVGCYLNVASQEGLSSTWVSFIFTPASRHGQPRRRRRRPRRDGCESRPCRGEPPMYWINRHWINHQIIAARAWKNN